MNHCCVQASAFRSNSKLNLSSDSMVRGSAGPLLIPILTQTLRITCIRFFLPEKTQIIIEFWSIFPPLSIWILGLDLGFTMGN